MTIDLTQKASTAPRLSKSRFIAGWQCPLRLWYAVHHPELAPPPDDRQQAIFDRGHKIGELAQQRYLGGRLVAADFRHIEAAIDETNALMAKPEVPVLYEPAILHRNVLTRVDILARFASGWDIIEVKSSTRAKEVFRVDLAVQYWILRGAGVPIDRAGLLLLNRDYVYPGGEYDLQSLFRFEELTEQCQARQGWVEEQVERFQAIVAGASPPAIEPGEQCTTPYTCPFTSHCWRDREQAANPITLLPNLASSRVASLREKGIEAIEDLPPDYRLTDVQQRVRQATLSGLSWQSSGLKAALEKVSWPLFYLDFEAAMMALPPYAGMRPYDPVPFQYSCHIQRRPYGSLEHQEFLATEDGDPRTLLAESLLDTLGDSGSIIVYSGYEQATINRLAQALPDQAGRLRALIPRLVDLLAIVRNHYYHPDFRGSFSIKKVLPALVEGMDYLDMEVADGEAAGRAWQQMLASEDTAEQERLAAALRAYCRQDSLAMYRLREALMELT
ncbi:DUF2779 domain-containing protein [Halorhodospira halochloris]|uniref:DUF2779 domain-containing protein n=1 Tax=Halorhodospira halochloris TaxID=1052 RepID=A0A125T2S5_HALHR|nr:DUF2779 domain-containing protein [Halorhodospira halochloris]MBK1652754.1 hypothetical protein [Halorhodospira halochloris]MCG5531561.1 DUF2779 domain-containing protein [Halorhodospira halochloris]MCG5549579.1 DUF2779 domain-containing protein [Halorhodospira halochloris]BAU58720.1 hypothetical protein HH1059_20150 [Halorhodospira halochloris]